MAAMVLLLTLVNLRPGGHFERLDHSELLTVMLSNHNASALLPTGSGYDRNSVYGDNFEWTNERGLTSSIISFSSSRGTNN